MTAFQAVFTGATPVARSIYYEENIMSINAAIHVGASKDTVIELNKAIKMILDAKVADAVQMAALDTLKEGVAVKNTTIANNHFSG
mgnify:CR=1 FL=1